MEWRKIPNYDNYEVSTNGDIRSIKKQYTFRNGRILNYNDKLLKPNKNNKGYLRVWLYSNYHRKQIFVHTAVAITYLENPKGYNQINHKDGNKLNNTIENIEWCDAKYNMEHRFNVLKQSIPIKNGKITKDQYIEIMENNNKNPNSYFIDKYGISKVHIWALRKGNYRKSWYNEFINK